MKLDRSTTKVYIAGCGGMLGEAVYNTFSEVSQVKATDIDVNEEWIEYADVRDMDSIRRSIVEYSPDILINLAAITDMEECETNQKDAWLTNSLGAENLAIIANQLDIPLVYISTAGIFGGEKEDYNDFDQPNPLSIYAKSKYAGEIFVREHVRKYYVVRAGWMMGGGPNKDKKFINKIYMQIKNGGKILRVVDDKLGTPTYTYDFAKGLIRIIQSDMYGIYNQVCGGASSRYEVAQEFVNLIGLSDIVKVVRVKSDYFRKEYFAPRPSSEMLENMKLDARNMNVMRDWRISLNEYAFQFSENIVQIRENLESGNKSSVYHIEEPLQLNIITESPSPHNNYLFSKIGKNGGVDLDVSYLFRCDNVPGRPWKNLEGISGCVKKCRYGVSRNFDVRAVHSTLRNKDTVNFIIGWNAPIFIILLTIIGLTRRPLLTWFDTPKSVSLGRFHPKSLLKRWAILMINRAPGTVFVTGRSAEKRLVEMGIKQSKIRNLPFFVPDTPPLTSLQDETSVIGKIFSDDRPEGLIVAAGRLIRSKGFDILLRSIAESNREWQYNFSLLIIGSGPELESLQKIVCQLDIENIVFFCPWLESTDFVNVFSMADIFVAPARFDPFPTTIISAMKAGIPVIATDGVGSAVELIETGESGVIVPKESVTDLSDQIQLLVNSPNIRNKLGQKAMKSVSRWPVEQGVCDVLDAAEQARLEL